MGIGHFFKHAKHKVEHAGNKVKHTAEHVGNEVKKTADKVGDTVSNLDPKHIADEAKDEILKALKSAENEAIASIKHVADQAEAELKKEFDEIQDAFKTRAAHEVLADLVDVIEALSPDEISVQLSAIQLTVGDVVSKTEHFVKWSKNPPHNRETYIAFVKDVSPESLTLIEDIGLGLLIQSEDAEIEITETWTGESILHNIDKILERAGIH